MVFKPRSGYYSSHPEKSEELKLIQVAQSPDFSQARAAKNKLICDNEGFLVSTIKKWFGVRPIVDINFLLEEARILFLAAIEHFDLSRDVSLRVYAKFHLMQLKGQSYAPTKYIELQDEYADKTFIKTDFHFKNFDLRETIKIAIDNCLTPVEKEVIIQHYLHGKKRKQIARLRQCSEARVCVIIKTALPKMKSFFENIGIDSDFFEFN